MLDVLANRPGLLARLMTALLGSRLSLPGWLPAEAILDGLSATRVIALRCSYALRCAPTISSAATVRSRISFS